MEPLRNNGEYGGVNGEYGGVTGQELERVYSPTGNDQSLLCNSTPRDQSSRRVSSANFPPVQK